MNCLIVTKCYAKTMNILIFFSLHIVVVTSMIYIILFTLHKESN